MTNAIADAITAKLNEMFAEMDAEVLARNLVWIEERAAAVSAFWKSEEYETIKRNSYAVYDRLFSIAGGKTWYNVIRGHGPAGRAEFVAKNTKATADARNASIVRKLLKAGVTEVTGSTYARTHDGFDGFFSVETDAGRKNVKIQTIGAGGYNIQCYHLRVLTKVLK
jgi:hypothetical protein